MEIPLNTRVFSEGKFCGYSRYVVMDPHTQIITHFVVNTEALIDPLEVVVPIDWLESADSHHIYLNHSQKELLELPLLQNLDYLGMWDPERGYYPHQALLWPYSLLHYPHGHFNIPKGEVLLEQGAEIHSSEGKRIGWVDELIADPHSGAITYLVMREGHFWHPKIVSVPARFIREVNDEIVYLSLDEHSAEELPVAEKG